MVKMTNDQIFQNFSFEKQLNYTWWNKMDTSIKYNFRNISLNHENMKIWDFKFIGSWVYELWDHEFISPWDHLLWVHESKR